jgi:hypothetical protein
MTIHLSCHCGGTKIELPHPPTSAKTCNCTFCAKSGAIWGYYAPGEVRIVAAAHDGVYSASNEMNLHHFCARCGGQTYGDSPDWASIYNADGTLKDGASGPIPTARTFGVNMRLADDFDIALLEVEAVDGRSNW